MKTQLLRLLVLSIAPWLAMTVAECELSVADQPGNTMSPANPHEPAPLWELNPLRVHCTIYVESMAGWSETRQQALADGILERCNSEFGQTWKTTVSVASAEQAALIKRAVHTRTLADLEPLAESELARDKWLLLTVQSSEPFPTLRAWEYDLISRRWSDGPELQVGDWQRLELMAFESLAEVCSPQAFVTTVTGPRLVLRLRGGLLPLPNPRRAAGGIGAVFQVCGEGATTFAKVESRDGAMLECRTLGATLPVQAGTEAKEYLAVQVRALHASTEMVVHLDAGEMSPPWIGCEVWISGQRDKPGQFNGRTDGQGHVLVGRSDGDVVWLHLRHGFLLLASVPVVPGFCQEQRIDSRIQPQALQVAEKFALCGDELAELSAFAESLRVRVKTREAAGQTDQAKSLERSGHELLTQRVDALHQRWQTRKAQAEQLAGKELPGAAAVWKELTAELNALRPIAESSPVE